MTNRIGASILVATIPTIGWWFIALDVSAPFHDIPSRAIWLGMTFWFGVMCLTYPGWSWDE